MKTYVKELKKGQVLENELFAIEEIQLHKARNGEPYYNLTLQDKTGDVKGKIWANNISNCEIENLQRGDAVTIGGSVGTYKETLQVIINSLKKVEEYDVSALLQVSERDTDQMWKELLGVIAAIKNDDLRMYLEIIFSDEVVVNRFKSFPGAQIIHHDFVGGLIEHTLEMIDLAKPFAKYYPEVNYDLVNAGILLHDIGKIFELNRSGTIFEKPTEGILLGHMYQGVVFLVEKRPKNFPEKLWMLLLHIIISHNGEHGDVQPATIEAAIVAGVDMNSFRVRTFQKEIRAGIDKPEELSGYQRYLGTMVYIGEGGV